MSFLRSRIFDTLIKVLLCVVGTFAPFVHTDAIQDNTSGIAFHDITIKKWHEENKTAKFIDVMATITNDYCSKNYAKCSLKFWNTTRAFKDSHIKLSPGYPKQLDDNLQINFYIVLPSGNDIRKNSSTVLPKTTTATILQINEDIISLKVGVKVKSNSDSSTTKTKLDNELNYIMIPVSFGVLLLVLATAFCLHLCHKRKIEDIQKAERQQYSSQQNAGGSLSPSRFAANAIPETIVKPQQLNPKTDHQETNRGLLKTNLPSSKNSIPEVIVKPQVRLDTNTRETDITCQGTSSQIEDPTDKMHSPPVKKKRHSHKKRKHQQENSHIAIEHEGQEEEQGSDQERQPTKHRRRKKKHRKRKDESATQQDGENETDREDGVDADISSRLPAPRKLPPLQKIKINDAGDENDGNDKNVS